MKKFGAKIATVRVPRRKRSKWPPWRRRYRNLNIREKETLQISVRLFVENLIKIDPSVWAVALSHAYTYTYTHIHTHTLSSIATYSIKMTEYKKGPVCSFSSLRGNHEKIFVKFLYFYAFVFSAAAWIYTAKIFLKKWSARRQSGFELRAKILCL